MTAYYNENNPYAAAWLRNLIQAGLIAEGDVDERSITDVQPDDLMGYTQCHFFAGIGGWARALRLAGVPEGCPIWTGSPPCQGWSVLGKRKGFSDSRHLWPEFFRLIKACHPSCIVGEQVASKDGLAWLDSVFDDMEAEDYTTRAVDLCASGCGAPHIRQRLYWCGISPGWVAYSNRADGQSHTPSLPRGAEAVWVNQPQDKQSQRACQNRGGERVADSWRQPDWVACQDGYWRPVEPWAFPLAYGISTRVGVLRAPVSRLARMAGLDEPSRKLAGRYRVGSLKGYGNAIVPPLAAVFVESVLDADLQLSADYSLTPGTRAVD